MPGVGALGQLALGELPRSSPEPVLESKWHQPFSEPVRQRIAPALAVALISSGAVLPPRPVVSFGWLAPLSEPVRVKPRLPEGEQQFLALHPAASPFVATGWFSWLSEPVRIRPRLPEGEQQFFAPDPFPRISIGWFNWLSEPVRTRPALITDEQRYFELQPPPVTIEWWSPFSEPVRIKPGLLAAAQPVFSFWPQPIPPVPGGGTSRRLGVPSALARWGAPDEEPPRKRAKPQRQVEPRRAPPTFKEYLDHWKPPPLVILDEMVRRPAAPVSTPLPDVAVRYPDRLGHIADALDEADDMRAIGSAIEALPDAGHEAARALIEDALDMRTIDDFIDGMD